MQFNKLNKLMINQLAEARSASGGTSLITMYLPGEYNL